MTALPRVLKASTSRTPVQVPQLWQGCPGMKLWPMHGSLVSRKAKVSPTASPVPYSLAAPPLFWSMPWPHSCRNTAAISPVFEQPPPERKKLIEVPFQPALHWSLTFMFAVTVEFSHALPGRKVTAFRLMLVRW